MVDISTFSRIVLGWFVMFLVLFLAVIFIIFIDYQFPQVSPLMVFSQCHPVLKGNIYNKVIVVIIIINIVNLNKAIVIIIIIILFILIILLSKVCLDEEKQASLEKSLLNQFSSECQQVMVMMMVTVMILI